MIPLLVLLLAAGQVAPSADTAPPAQQFAPPDGVRAFDTPNDAGKSISLSWSAGEGTMPEAWLVERTEPDTGPKVIATNKPDEAGYLDEDVRDGIPYTYRVAAVTAADTVWSEPSPAVKSSPQFFNMYRLNILIAMVIFFALVVYYIESAKRGKSLFVRRIAGLDAVEEAVGRATEMGKPIVYVPGLGSVADIATIASLNILGEVAKKTAQYDSALLVPNRDPIVYTVAREIVKESYTKAGRPDAFRQDSVFFVTSEQFAYAAAVDGLMAREKPATNFFLGMFWAESLILAETGAQTGAIQIAGTDSVFQLPFFITACDYTLIGEELYAASAYLSREPLLLGSLKGQDYGKIIILAIVVLGSALLLLSGISALSSLARIADFFSVR
ncbi:fibronectin type III domain-containing protein [candidate division WOR-3 bacterium]|nr:fibronectin type III domain-containing protein [candidate division WOR-3 bacterium]